MLLGSSWQLGPLAPTSTTACVFPAALLSSSSSPVDFSATYHVKGKHVHGFVLDPGAATGLIGTETLWLRKIDNLDPRNLTYTTIQILESIKQMWTTLIASPDVF